LGLCGQIPLREVRKIAYFGLLNSMSFRRAAGIQTGIDRLLGPRACRCVQTAYGSDVTSYLDQGSSASPLGSGSVLIGNPLSTHLSCVSGVSVSSGGEIFVATATGVEVFDGAGAPVASAGYPMSANPGGIAADPTSSYAYVTDSNNGAVYQYQLTGTTLTLTKTRSHLLIRAAPRRHHAQGAPSSAFETS
jgi:hypothetical protein